MNVCMYVCMYIYIHTDTHTHMVCVSVWHSCFERSSFRHLRCRGVRLSDAAVPNEAVHQRGKPSRISLVYLQRRPAQICGFYNRPSVTQNVRLKGHDVTN